MRIEISKRGGWLTGWSISALVVIIAGLSLGSVDHTPSPIASSFFGMNLIKPKVWPNAPIGALGKGLEPHGAIWSLLAGFTSGTARTNMSRPHNGMASMPCKPLIAHHSGPRRVLSKNAMWARLDVLPPADIRDWDDFVTAVVTRVLSRSTNSGTNPRRN